MLLKGYIIKIVSLTTLCGLHLRPPSPMASYECRCFVVKTGVKAVCPPVLHLFFDTVCAGTHGRIRLGIKSVADCLVC